MIACEERSTLKYGARMSASRSMKRVNTGLSNDSLYYIENPDSESMVAMMNLFERFEGKTGLDARKFSLFHYSKLEYFRIIVAKSISLFKSEYPNIQAQSSSYKMEQSLFLDAVFERYLLENTSADQVKKDLGLHEECNDASLPSSPTASTDRETMASCSQDEMTCDSLDSASMDELFSKEEIDFLLEEAEEW